MAEIMAAARRQLRAGDEYSIRSVATEIGLSSQGLYRYVASIDQLHVLVADQILDSMLADMTQARDRHQDPLDRINAASVGFRNWALANAAEFRHAFTHSTIDDARRISRFLGELLDELGHARSADQSQPAGELDYLWARLYGMVALEAFQQVDAHVVESGRYFRTTLTEIAARLAISDPAKIDQIFEAETQRR